MVSLSGQSIINRRSANKRDRCLAGRHIRRSVGLISGSVIKPVLFDVGDDRRWCEKVDTLSTTEPGANVRRRNINTGHVDDARDTLIHGEIAIAPDHCNTRELLHPFGLIPMREIAHGIASHNQEQFGIGMTVAQCRQCVNRIRWILALPLDVAHMQTRRVGNGNAQHRQTVGKRRDRTRIFEGRSSIRNEKNFIAGELIACAGGENQVPVVNGIERSSENCNASRHVRGPPSLRGLRLVTHLTELGYAFAGFLGAVVIRIEVNQLLVVFDRAVERVEFALPLGNMV